MIKQLLLVTGEASSDADNVLQERLSNLGYQVITKKDGKAAEYLKANKQSLALIVISSSASDSVITAEFRNATIPLVLLKGSLFPEMGMTGRSDVNQYGQASGQTVVIITGPNHPMAGGLSGSVFISPTPINMAWGAPGKEAFVVATLTRHLNKAVLFGYEDNAVMVGLNAPARRIGILFDESLASNLKSDYWILFDATIEWGVGESPRQFSDMLRAEWEEIQTRRGQFLDQPPSETEKPLTLPPSNMAGLALSGGGIRAATFGLGLLQGMRELGLLSIFDYLSTVSGGGYLGGWWSAWLSRELEEQPEPPSVSQSEDGQGAQNKPPQLFPPAEKIVPVSYPNNREKNWESRKGVARPYVNQEEMESVFSAGNDPIHHLRLFANYLTPRKGALSADTWRAVTNVIRGLVLTWLILLPLLVAAVLAGKIYFILQPGSYDPGAINAFFVYEPGHSSGMSSYFMPASQEVLRARLWLVAWPLLALLGWIAAMSCAWVASGGDAAETRRESYAGRMGVVISLILVGLLGLIIYQNYRAEINSFAQHYWRMIVIWTTGLLMLLMYAFVPGNKYLSGDDSKAAGQWQKEVRRYRIARVEAKLLVALVIVALVLLLAGFGQEMINFLIRPSAPVENAVAAYIAKSGGWITILAAIAGSIFTAIKTSPAGGSDAREAEEPSTFSRIIFKLTPPLVIVVLIIIISWLASLLLHYFHGLYHFVYDPFDSVPRGAQVITEILEKLKTVHYIQNLELITSLGILLSFYLAVAETKWKNNRPTQMLSALWALLALTGALTLVSVVYLVLTGSKEDKLTWNALFFSDYEVQFSWTVVTIALFVCWLCGVLIVYRVSSNEVRKPRSVLWVACFALVWLMLLGGTFWQLYSWYLVYTEDGPTMSTWMAIFIFGGLLFCLSFAVLEWLMGRSDNKRPLTLLLSVYIMLTALFIIELVVDYTYVTLPESLIICATDPEMLRRSLDFFLRVLFGEALFSLISVALVWLVSMGWMANPNSFSMHSFYKARLVRAYLGASNKHRSEQRKRITEAVEGDDVLLQDLKNCQRGAPYHLINTTLNLVGGRDLTTAQRSAAAFVLSKYYCGSSRTGYRDTREYMGGQLSLGTAVAISGAAASPNMGAKTLTASLAMLMTFLNVRLGYWAPTPNKKDWRLSKARLWPFYMMRELLSQTNDLSTYCYLTDGGHFDNTGLYTLVERGCRFIVVADCGADPKPCFQDLGDALRRCRIDFDAEINLDISPLIREGKGKSAKQHFVVGTILYSRDHVANLKWPLEQDLSTPERRAQDELARTGTIILFKPALTNKDESVDVRQYGLENPGFPQQKTVDQWYDEAQFESYRQLGKLCTELAFDKLPAVAKFKAPNNTERFVLKDIEDIFEQARLRFDPQARPAGEHNNGDELSVSGGTWWQMRFVKS